MISIYIYIYIYIHIQGTKHRNYLNLEDVILVQCSAAQSFASSYGCFLSWSRQVSRPRRAGERANSSSVFIVRGNLSKVTVIKGILSQPSL